MGKMCIPNVDGHGVLLAEHLKTEGKVSAVEFKGNRVCVDFEGTLTITFEDYVAVHQQRELIERSKARLEREKWAFNRWIQTEIIRSLRAGEVVEYVPGDRITVRSTEKTEIVCIRLTPEEKRWLEEAAEKAGVTVSELVRDILRRAMEEGKLG